jgi:hypothetical protein
MCRFLPVNLRPINWIEELTSRAYTNWKKSGMNLPDIERNANTRENNLFRGYGGCCVVGIGDDKLDGSDMRGQAILTFFHRHLFPLQPSPTNKSPSCPCHKPSCKSLTPQWHSVTWYIVLRPVHDQSMSSAFCIMNNVLHRINTFLCLLVVGFR